MQKDEPVTDKEVGDFVASLHKDGMEELTSEVLTDGVAFDSTAISTEQKDTD